MLVARKVLVAVGGRECVESVCRVEVVGDDASHDGGGHDAGGGGGDEEEHAEFFNDGGEHGEGGLYAAVFHGFFKLGE